MNSLVKSVLGRQTRIDGARLVEVIQLQTTEGNGDEDDPVRNVVRYYTKQGQLIGEFNPNATREVD